MAFFLSDILQDHNHNASWCSAQPKTPLKYFCLCGPLHSLYIVEVEEWRGHRYQTKQNQILLVKL
jgi:hypothetical protein